MVADGCFMVLPTFDIQKGEELADVPGHSHCLGSLVLFGEQELQPEPEFLGGSSTVTEGVPLVAQSGRESA